MKTLTKRHEAVLKHVKSQPRKGATGDEIEIALGILHQSLGRLLLDLRGAKLLFDSKRSRETRTGCKAIVWVASQRHVAKNRAMSPKLQAA